MRPLPFAAVCAAVCAWVGWLLAGSMLLEWYFCSDMDLSAVVDQIRVNSNETPYWLHHTSYTMNLVLHLASLARLVVTGAPLPDFATLREAASPILVVADLAGTLRAVSPVAAVAGALLTWEAVRRGLRLNTAWALAALVVALSSDWVVYHSFLVRSELYSIAPWGGALLAGVLALDARSRAGALALWTLAGAALALAFLSKVQTVVLVASAGTFWAGLVLLRGTDGLRRIERLAAGPRAAALPLALLAALLALFEAARRFTMPEAFVGAYFEGAPPHYGFARQMAMFTAALVAAALAFAFGGRWRHGAVLRGAAAAVVAVIAGFLAAFLTHFVMYASVPAGWHYLLADFKVAMMRMEGIRITRFHEAMANLRDVVKQAPVLHAVYLGTVAAGLAAARARRDKAAAALVALTAAMAVFQALFVIRPMPRDTMFPELLFLVAGGLNLAFAAAAWRRAGGLLAAAAVALVLAEGLPSAAFMHRYVELNYARYSWHVPTWLDGDRPLTAVNQDAYGNDQPLRMAAAQQGVGVRRLAHAVGFVLPSHRAEPADLGLLLDGAPAGRGTPRARLAEVPAEWRGASFVDLAHLARRRDPLPAPEGIAGHDDKVAHLRPWLRPAEDVVEVVPRLDLALALAVPPQTARALEGGALGETGNGTIAVATAAGGREILVIVPVAKARLIPRESLGGRALLLLRPCPEPECR